MYTTTANTGVPQADTTLLVSLYELGRRGRPIHLVSLAQAVGTDVRAVLAALARLEARGLVSAPRYRLTMLGLGVAARLARTRESAKTRAA
jgi:Mn-dependent DtxR family transcriptional regulator